MIDTVIFDMDGTTLDTLCDLHIAVNYALEKSGCPPVTFEHVRKSVGNGVGKLVERCLPEGKENLFSQCLAIFKEKYELCKDDHTAPYAGAAEAIKKLKEMGIKTAIVSNKIEIAVKQLCDKWFEGLIDCAVGDDGKRPLKPDPAPVLFALESLGSSKDCSVYVGDMEYDVMTARNSGLRFLGAGWGFRGKDFLIAYGEKSVFDSFDEIVKFVETENLV